MRTFPKKDVEKIVNMTLERLRSRSDFSKLNSKDGSYSKALKAERDKVIREKIGVWIENSKHRDSFTRLKKDIADNMNKRRRKGQRRTEPKKKPRVVAKEKPLGVHNIGNEKTRQRILEETYPNMDIKSEQCHMLLI